MIIPFPRVPRCLLERVLAAPTARASHHSALVPLPRPAALARARTAIACRARHVGADDQQLRAANRVALLELDAGRSLAAAIALAFGELTGRRNALLHPAARS